MKEITVDSRGPAGRAYRSAGSRLMDATAHSVRPRQAAEKRLPQLILNKGEVAMLA